MGRLLDLEQPFEPAALTRAGGERLYNPNIGDDVHQFAAHFGGAVGMNPVPRRTAMAGSGEQTGGQ
jgi:hypothetical protein